MTDPSPALELLIVEDSETDAKLVVQELRKSGFAPRWERVDTVGALGGALRRRHWQLVISDSSVPGLHPLEALAMTQAVAPGVPFIVVSGTVTEEIAVAALRMGAADYVSKERLCRLGPAVVRALEESSTRVELVEKLTPRQREILRLIADGYSTRDIAGKLRISRKTVESHRAQIMERLDIHHVAGLVRYAIRAGVVRADV